MSQIIHFEIYAENPGRAARFYSELFDWTIKEWLMPGEQVTAEEATDENGYWIIKTEPEKATDAYADLLPKAVPAIPSINGAILFRKGHRPTGFEPVTAFVCTMGVDNLDDSLKRTVSLGGQMVSPKKPVKGVGWVAYAKDTEGNIFGMMEADREAQ